jgi:hypothetical protein
MPSDPKTVGRALDEIIAALEPLEEPTRIVAVRAACEQLHIATGPVGAAPPLGGAVVASPLPTPPLASSAVPPSAPALDIRALKEQKKPTTAQEMACLVAHYLQTTAPQAERKDAIGTSDIDRYFRQADFPLPKGIGQLLPDAKAAGYFDSAGRGAYRLNAVGHNLVVHRMPRQVSGAAPQAPARRASPRKRTKLRKAASRGKK